MGNTPVDAGESVGNGGSATRDRRSYRTCHARPLRGNHFV